MSLSRKDVLEALGIEKREDRFMTGLMIGIGVGAVLGGIVAMLVAPRSGAELRAQLGERGRDVMERMRGRTEEMGATRIEPGT